MLSWSPPLKEKHHKIAYYIYYIKKYKFTKSNINLLLYIVKIWNGKFLYDIGGVINYT